MQSKAKDVNAYLAEVREDRLVALTNLRTLCLELLQGYQESMVYGMPSYAKNGVVEVAFASQKNCISLYMLKEEVLDKYRHMLEDLNMGKGCIRYTKPEKIDFDLVRLLLAESYKSESEIC